MKQYDRQLRFSGAAFYPLASAVAGVFVTGITASVTNHFVLTLVVGISALSASLMISGVCGLEYYEHRRGKHAPQTRIAHNGQRVYDRMSNSIQRLLPNRSFR